MAEDPTDAELEAMLGRVPAESWDRLWTAMARLEADPEPFRWVVGEPAGTTAAGQPVTQMPYVASGEALDAVIACLGSAGLVVPFDWMGWDGARRHPGGAGLDGAPVADAVRLITAIVRGERFGEGTIAGAVEDGTLAAIVRRLRTWVDEGR